MNASDHMRTLQLAADGLGSRLFRNNVAQGVVGNVEWGRPPGKMVRLGPGDALVRHARVLHAGLCEGSSDLVGGTPVLIRPEHVGATIAALTVIEVKSGGGRSTEAQKRFIGAMAALGGIAGVARTEEDLRALLSKFA